MAAIAFGVRLPVAGPLAQAATIKQAVITAEELGFDTAWVHDFVIWTKQLDQLHISCGSADAVDAAGPDYPPVFYESLSNLAFCAAVTERIRLGVAVLCLPYREPVVTAKQIATIDALSNGRLDLGIGQGAPKQTFNVDFEVLGIPRARKTARTREHFEAMRKIWTEAPATYQGEMVHFENAVVYPRPVQSPHPPIWIGGSAPLSLDLVADHADAWLSFFVPPDHFPTAIADLHERLEARGRPTASLTIASELYCVLADTTEEAERRAAPTMTRFGEAMAGTTGRFAPSGQSTDTYTEVRAASLIGSPAAIRERLGEYVAAGVQYFELKFLYRSIDEMFYQWRTFADEVMPAFR